MIKEIKELIENIRQSQDIVIEIENLMQKLKARWKTTRAFLHTNSKQSEKEIKKTIPFTITSKNNKILRNLPRRQKPCTIKSIKHCWKN